jgi:hypothetical protein
VKQAALDRHKKHLPKQLASDPAAEIVCEPSTLLELIPLVAPSSHVERARVRHENRKHNQIQAKV